MPTVLCSDSDRLSPRLTTAVIAAVLLWLALSGYGLWLASAGLPRLQLLPMIGALDNCLLARDSAASIGPCGGKPDSAERLIEATLGGLGPRISKNGQYEVGYTLHVPLLRLFQKNDRGEWVVDSAAASRIARTISDVDRPVLIYLFSTHFSVGGELEAELFLDPSNLAHTKNGPLPKDRYYHLDIFPWTVSRTDNALTHYRKEAIRAVLDAVCGLQADAISRVAGVSVLGEVHQLFPGFEAGMGFSSPYVITDYSNGSKQGFQRFLAANFHNISSLNLALASDYLNFEDISPPSLDIRKDKLERFHQHIDAYAAGFLPVSGWVHVNDGLKKSNWVRIYVNGAPVARVPAKFGRQDVLAANPAIRTADVGWRHDIDFSNYKPGLYRIDIVLERGQGSLRHLASRTVGVIDRTQAAPSPLPVAATDTLWPKAEANTLFWVDTPADYSSVYFNPLVNLWHRFRERQVTDYLRHVAEGVKQSCLGQGPVYTHQIVPFVNPGWDATRFSIDDSLKPTSGLRLGISLYGEPIYGTSVTDWLRRRANSTAPYGITEFHPLKGMNPKDLELALRAHRQSGAKFVSFFMEPRWAGQRIEPGMNLFSLDPENSKYGADETYRSFSTLLKQP